MKRSSFYSVGFKGLKERIIFLNLSPGVSRLIDTSLYAVAMGPIIGISATEKTFFQEELGVNLTICHHSPNFLPPLIFGFQSFIFFYFCLKKTPAVNKSRAIHEIPIRTIQFLSV